MVATSSRERLRLKHRGQVRKPRQAEEWVHLSHSSVPGHARGDGKRDEGPHCQWKPPELHLSEHQVPPATAVLCREGFTPRIYWCNSQDYNKMSVRSTIQHVMVPMAIPPLQDGDPVSTSNMPTQHADETRSYWWFPEAKPSTQFSHLWSRSTN